MNAGRFSPHSSHKIGNDVDGWFPGYNARDAAAAQTMIAHLNTPAGAGIALVFVTYSRTATDPFWAAIKDVVLGDGRRARDVILVAPGHGGHFHWRVR